MNLQANGLNLVSDARKTIAMGVIIMVLGNSPRKAQAEEFVDTKFMYYQEDHNRIKVLAPTLMSQLESESGWVIKLDGVYNSITGATPIGAPPLKPTPAPASSRSYSAPTSPQPTVTAPTITPPREREDEREEREGGIISGTRPAPLSARIPVFAAVSGATPTAGTPTPAPSTSPSPAPAPSAPSGNSGSSGGGSSTAASSAASTTPGTEIPSADFSDQRWAFNIGLSKRFGNNTPSAQLSYSQETDYRSTGISLQEALDLNKKNTTLLLGGALTHDNVNPANGRESGTKDTVDAMIGVTQVLTPTTLLTANLTVGDVTGYISDPYKLADVNGTLIYEKRPETKNKQVLYLGLNQFITPLDASIEAGLRYYRDSFGISAETLSLAWFQKLGSTFILSPSLRYYTQTAADFYDIHFTGAPEFYSSDYRLSSFDAVSAGLELIWMPNSRLSLDVGIDRYQQTGNDGKTDPNMYTAGTLFIVGARWAL